MLAEIDKEKNQAREETKVFVQNLQTQKVEIESKAENLLDLFIDGKGIEPEEYQAKKSKLLNEKQDIIGKIRDFEQKGNNWLEPMKEMIFKAKQAKILLSQNDKTQIRAFLKKIGSNFRIADRTLVLDFKNTFKIAEKYHAEALCAEAVSYDFTKSENWRCFLIDVRTFFEQNPQ